MKLLQESVDRLIAAGDLLPETKKGYLIPCR
jgi:hypothetical protein